VSNATRIEKSIFLHKLSPQPKDVGGSQRFGGWSGSGVGHPGGRSHPEQERKHSLNNLSQKTCKF